MDRRPATGDRPTIGEAGRIAAGFDPGGRIYGAVGRPDHLVEARPMKAAELYKAGRLREAIEAQVLDVKRRPPTTPSGCSSSSCSLFAGDLERARRQIEACRIQGSGPRRRDGGLPQAAGRRAGAARPVRPRRRAGVLRRAAGALAAAARGGQSAARGAAGGGRRDPGPGQRGHPGRHAAGSTASRSSRSATPTTCSPACWKSWPTAGISGSASSRCGW